MSTPLKQLLQDLAHGGFLAKRKARKQIQRIARENPAKLTREIIDLLPRLDRETAEQAISIVAGLARENEALKTIIIRNILEKENLHPKQEKLAKQTLTPQQHKTLQQIKQQLQNIKDQQLKQQLINQTTPQTLQQTQQELQALTQILQKTNNPKQLTKLKQKCPPLYQHILKQQPPNPQQHIQQKNKTIPKQNNIQKTKTNNTKNTTLANKRPRRLCMECCVEPFWRETSRRHR